ncbi:hypothetical protein AB3N04_01145 (plasmid) [Alkalihalophilus sp. As8PL]|uniref:PXO1-76 n=1 Tax=Alkalihalophilus sp. As8PL TaxID=3237103 RepID=A0AB39BN47_9BACI
MMDIVVLTVLGSVAWVVYAVSTKRSLIPFYEKKVKLQTPTKKTKNKRGSKATNQPQNTKKNAPTDEYAEEEPDLFSELLGEVKTVKNHMIHLTDERFVMFTEVEPCNYFLRSQEEQESIDDAFETWLSSIDGYQVQWYLQNRYIDLSEPIEEMQENMIKSENMSPNAIDYGKGLLNDLRNWQASQPRYETKRYLIFVQKADPKKAGVVKGAEDYEEKIVERAFGELYRRVNNAKNMLKRANMEVELLTGEGIAEVLYHTLNRRKAPKLKFKNIKEREMLSLYSTADKSEEQIEAVKESGNHVQNLEKEKEQAG